MTAINNWWGCNGGPGQQAAIRSLRQRPRLTSTPGWCLASAPTPLRSIQRHLNADRRPYAQSGGTGGFSVPNGTPVSFGGTLDSSVNPTAPRSPAARQPRPIRRDQPPAPASGTATVDNQQVSTPIDILVSVARPVTVTTSPANLSITVDGTTYTAPQTFNWVVGSSHTLATTSPQAGPRGSQYVWNSWSQGGAQSQRCTRPVRPQPTPPTSHAISADHAGFAAG